MSQSSNNTILASIAVLVIFALAVAWYVNTHPTLAPQSSGAASSSAQIDGQLQGTVR